MVGWQLGRRGEETRRGEVVKIRTRRGDQDASLMRGYQDPELTGPFFSRPCGSPARASVLAGKRTNSGSWRKDSAAPPTRLASGRPSTFAHDLDEGTISSPRRPAHFLNGTATLSRVPFGLFFRPLFFYGIATFLFRVVRIHWMKLWLTEGHSARHPRQPAPVRASLVMALSHDRFNRTRFRVGLSTSSPTRPRNLCPFPDLRLTGPRVRLSLPDPFLLPNPRHFSQSRAKSCKWEKEPFNVFSCACPQIPSIHPSPEKMAVPS